MEVTKPNILNSEQHKKPNKKKKGNNANNELPTDVITSIFVRFPGKALSMLRCVSKSWNDLIISPPFVSTHRKQSMENGPKLLFVERVYLLRSREHKLRFVSVDMEGEKESNQELCTVTVPGQKHALCEWTACSGLICILIDRRIYLCNPAIHQVCELPRCSPSAFSVDNLVAFGYLHSQEYKVVHFFYKGTSFSFRELQFAQLKCEVLTLNEVSGISNGWKEITEMPPYHPDSSGLSVNECMYWFSKPLPYGQYDQIVSLDFENEKFLTISRPSCFEPLSGLKMMDLKGMLCLPDTRRFPQSSVLDLWILTDKISCTWVKEYSINMVNFGLQDIKPLTWNEEIIFRHLDTLVFYDLKRKSR